MRLRLIGIIALLAACGGGGQSKQPPYRARVDTRSLFERLGGQPAINAVVHEFVMTTHDDPRISMYFTNVDAPKLEAAMDQHICSITGGQCEYKGKTMLAAHTNMKLQEKDFDAFMDDLTKVLAKLQVPSREAGEVVAAFTQMKADVVGH